MAISHTDDTGLELGSRRFLHPGPLRWLRTLGWAVLLFFIFMLGDAAATLLPDQAVKAGHDLLAVLETALLCAAAFGLYGGVVRLAEGRWPSEIAIGPAGRELLVGLAIGVAMMTAVIGLLVGFGLYDVKGPHAASPMLMIKTGVVSGMMEELIMRAIVLRLLMRAFGAWPALLAQAALFGLMHLANPHSSMTAAVAIALEAGLMLASFYLLTGRIWMSIGVHAAWNFSQGWLWGAPVSGAPVSASVFVSTPHPGAADLISGGAFGPEASLPAALVGTGVAVIVLVWAWRKGRFQARRDAIPPIPVADMAPIAS